MIQTIKKTAFNILDTFAWKTDRKIIVLESDDWGSIRMPSYETYQHCINKGYQVDKSVFSKYDALASEDDLTMLFDLLLKFKDAHGNHPVITANCLVTNPDFERIKENGFQKYEYELITETFKKYPKHNHCFDLWIKGLDEGIFMPQSHGREHLNVSRFMTDLQAKNPHANFAFENSMPGIFDPNNLKEGNNYVVSLEYTDAQDEQEKCYILREGLAIFEALFGFKSETFIATNYIWSPKMEKTLADKGVHTLQGSRFQLIPKGNYEGFQKKVHYTGQKNKNNQQYWVRNAYFEPSLNFDKDSVNSTIAEIERAFLKKMPALISTHRINFVGYIDEANRDRSLRMLNDLLKNIVKKWPDVEFMSSSQLSRLMINNNNSNTSS